MLNHAAIEETGYNRRDEEVAELEGQLSGDLRKS
jgi:hypothetical protein